MVLSKLESEYIKKYGSLSPKGYNLEYFQPFRVLSPQSLKKMSRIQQGSKKRKSELDILLNKKVIGVWRDGGKFRAGITFRNKDHTKTCDTVEKAIEVYDKLALSLFGKRAKINNESKREEYLSSNLQEFLKEIAPKYASNYNGVTFSKPKGRWKVCISRKCHKILKNEIEAAEVYDKAVLYFNLDKQKMNFPQKTKQYLSEDLRAIFFQPPKTSKYRGVCYIKRTGKWSAKAIVNNAEYFCGNWDSEIQAAQEVDKVVLHFSGNLSRLNFPNKVDEYIKDYQEHEKEIKDPFKRNPWIFVVAVGCHRHIRRGKTKPDELFKPILHWILDTADIISKITLKSI